MKKQIKYTNVELHERIIDVTDIELNRLKNKRECFSFEYDKDTYILKLKTCNDSISEYIGSHIYRELGYPCQDTMFARKDGGLYVACKSFEKDPWRLITARDIMNKHREKLSRLLGYQLSYLELTEFTADLRTVLINLEYNPVFVKIPNMKQHFWNMVVIDAFLGNWDRSCENWGILYNELTGEYKPAPIYDNDNSFPPVFQLEDDISSAFTISTANNAISAISFRVLLALDDPTLKEAIAYNVPLIRKSMSNIFYMIDFISPEVCSHTKKERYKKFLETQIDLLLLPIFNNIHNGKEAL